MKEGNAIVTVILIAAVLLAACGLGLLIRQARLGDPKHPPRAVAEPNAPAPTVTPALDRRIGQRGSEPKPEQLAAQKQQRTEELAEIGTLTEEQRQQRRDAMRAQLRSQSREPGRVPHLSPEELQEISRRWPQMTEEERQAFRSALSRTRSADRPERFVTADANAPATTEPNTADGN